MQPNPFKDQVFDTLQYIGGLHCERFFRHWGLYYGGHFIGIIVNNRLYLRTNSLTRKAYEDHGMKSFRETDKTLRRFYQVPHDVVNDTRELKQWTRDALTVRYTVPDHYNDY